MLPQSRRKKGSDPVMEQIYAVSEQALFAGQDKIQIQIFPFRMTDANLAAQAGSKWFGFWRNLKEAYDSFEETQLPPSVGVCRKTYVITPENDDELATAAECTEEVPTLIATKPRRKSFAAKAHSGGDRIKRAARSRATRAAASWSDRAFGKPRARKTVAARSVRG